jgi:eukaryotic-like serine/threonine-protein kinase
METRPGDKLGPYEIVALLGKGGMGEVWRARDTRLGREVAIKLSAQQFTDRFEREARAIAALNHTTVCTLYDIGPNYLVMELIEGPTLADRIASDGKPVPIPLDEALGIARQIADALEAAHEKNIVHRDLKPANIKIRPDGSVKVLDFGLAKSAEQSELSADSPTMMSMTAMGMIMGTAGYMAPEQAHGKKDVDKRADIWAFGVVLYEMLTARRLFQGDDIADTLASVIKEQPDLDGVPPRVLPLLKRCLEKDPKKRLRDIGDWELLLAETPATAPAPSLPGTPRWVGMTAWMGAAVFAIAAAALAFVHFREKPPLVQVVNSALLPPEGAEFNFAGAFGLPALSPDGTRIVFGAASKDGRKLLYMRRLDSPTAQPLQGSDDGMFPFWSPDSRWVAFEQNSVLKKIDTQGGPPVTLGHAGQIRGGTWSSAGVILFGTQNDGLMRMPAAGGTATQIVPMSMGSNTYPWFLPDGRHFLYSHRQVGDIPLNVGSLDEPGKPGKVVAQVHSNAAYALGHLFYLRDQALMAQPFDLTKLETTGEAVPVAEGIPTYLAPSRPAPFTVSTGGLLAYASSASSQGSKLDWKDRAGKTLSTLGEAKGMIVDPVLSPDGKRLAVAMLDPGANANANLWIFDTERGIPTRFTFDAAVDRDPVWSPDGAMIYFSSTHTGQRDLYRKASNGSGVEQSLLSSDVAKISTSVSADGQLLMFSAFSPGTSSDIWFLPLAPGRPGEKVEPRVFLQTHFDESGGAFRADGRWVAYTSAESGRAEVYVAPFPGPGGKRQVSSAGGVRPQWRRDGKELFYETQRGQLMAAEVIEKGGTLEIGKVQQLFDGLSRNARIWTASPDGQKFIVGERPGTDQMRPLTLVQNWLAALRR